MFNSARLLSYLTSLQSTSKIKAYPYRTLVGILEFQEKSGESRPDRDGWTVCEGRSLELSENITSQFLTSNFFPEMYFPCGPTKLTSRKYIVILTQLK